MENIIDKLNQIDKEDTKTIWHNWSLEDIKKILDIYLIICKKESHILDLIYSYQGVDNWEDIFRDYDEVYLENKANGVKMAINEIEYMIENESQSLSEYESECHYNNVNESDNESKNDCDCKNE